MSTDDNTSYFWQKFLHFGNKKRSVLHAGGVCEAPWVKLATGCYL